MSEHAPRETTAPTTADTDWAIDTGDGRHDQRGGAGEHGSER
ncbi:hypothetical protein ACN263_13365 [Micromonospora sp. WMMD729]